jgi:apolipoprotein N-acyltransferase
MGGLTLKTSFSAYSGAPAHFTRKTLLAILSGIMLTASFPPGNMHWMAWIALIPLLKGLEEEPSLRSFMLGYIAGAAHYLSLIYWIVLVLGHYGNLNILASIGPYILLCAYLALYPAFFSLLIKGLKDSYFGLFFMASFWVGLEFLRAKLLTGFPWCLLGYTQYKNLHMIQIADLCGVYGLSFLIVIANGLIYRFIFWKGQRGGRFPRWDIVLTALLAVCTIEYGAYRISEDRMEMASRQRLRCAVIQGNIDQSVKWDPEYQGTTISTYQRLTRASYAFRPGLIVWPETSVPFFFQDDSRFSPAVYSIANESKAALIFGSPAYKRISGRTRYFNRAYLIAPDGEPPRYYDKVQLVPFGEYVPLKKYLFFVNHLVTAAGDFEPGSKIAPLEYGDLSVGILICFEAIFPELARSLARGGANLLVNLTNDAWFGMTSAPYQHLSMSVFRAVENRMPMIRAANTGFSAFIGPQGKIIKLSGLFREEVMQTSLTLSNSPLTFYARFGDLFAILLLVISLMKVCFYIRDKLSGHR